MTIRTKLYYGFGSVVAVMILLFFINVTAVLRERSARAAAAVAIEEMQSVESVRFQVMQNHLYVRSYLLSGSLSDEKNIDKGTSDLSELFRKG
jgi:CHASE3 domain sensor protein